MFLGGLHDNNHVKECLMFNIDTKVFKKLSPMRSPRSAFGIVLIKNHVYAIGGSEVTGLIQSSLERYDILEDKWMDYFNLPQETIALTAV